MASAPLACTAAWLWDAQDGLRRGQGQWLVLEGGRIREIAGQPPPGLETLDLGSGLLLPGLVNAHTHLELSFLAGAVPPAQDFVGWLHQMVASRPGVDRGDAARHTERAIASLCQGGVALVADITNTGRAQELLARAGLSAVSFHEALGQSKCEPPQAAFSWHEGCLVGHGVAAHAPYSVPSSRLKALKEKAGSLPFCMHLAESRAEVEFMLGQGQEGARLERFLLERGLKRQSLELSGLAPLAHVQALGALDSHTLLVHGVQLTKAEVADLAATGASLCLCPRSNLGLTGALAPVAELLAAGVNLCLGTDSLASAPDLSLWAEISTLRRHCPDTSPAAILAMATAGGALALGLAGQYGSLAPGARAPLVFVPLKELAGDEVLEAVVRGDWAGQLKVLGGLAAQQPQT